MNRVMIRGEQMPGPAWAPRAAGFCKKALRKLSLDNFELSVVFCNNDFIRSLNKRFRGKDEPTDILSFPQGEVPVLPGGGEGARVIGDMVISLDMLRANGRDFSVPEEEELKRLLVHGILHLAGRDHTSSGPEEPMLILQEEILQELSEEKIF
jgi:probable rRNA maturation factor